MTDAGIEATHKQHGLRHDVMQFHGVVACATGHAVHGYAQWRDRVFPALLPGWCAGGCTGTHGLLQRVVHTATLTNGFQAGQHIGGQAVTLGVVRRTQIEAEIATPGDYVDGAIGYLQNANRGNRVTVRCSALFNRKYQLRHGGGRIPAAVHGRGAGMAGHANDVAGEPHAGVDRGDDP